MSRYVIQHYPTCDKCGEKIIDLEGYQFDSEILCYDCAKHLFKDDLEKLLKALDKIEGDLQPEIYDFFRNVIENIDYDALDEQRKQLDFIEEDVENIPPYYEGSIYERRRRF